MRPSAFPALLAAGLILYPPAAHAQQPQPASQEGVQQQVPYQSMTPEQRAASTRSFLGLGALPDRAAAERGAPLYQQTCAFCHGPQARGATAPSLITSDEVLGDDHGERLVAFLKKGRPEKGMPAYATVPDSQLSDITEFLHVQVEDVANRGAYHVLNILVGNADAGRSYVNAHCISCHTSETFAHIGGRYRSPEQLQRNWIWPSRSANPSLAITATVTPAHAPAITGRVTQLSDFRITLVDASGQSRAIDLQPGIAVSLNDPLAPHQKFILTLANDDMQNVTAYLSTLK